MTTDSPLGIQLYSVRDDIAPAQLDGTLARLAAMGFTHAEPYDILSDPPGLANALRRSGLRATTAHAAVQLLDETAIAHEPVLILGTGANAVLIGEEDWNAIQETLCLLSVPGMRESIREGITTSVENCRKEPGW